MRAFSHPIPPRSRCSYLGLEPNYSRGVGCPDRVRIDKTQSEHNESVCSSKADTRADMDMCRFVPIPDSCGAATEFLFDDLVRPRLRCREHLKATCRRFHCNLCSLPLEVKLR